MNIEEVKETLEPNLSTLESFASKNQHRLIFATISGAHLYGFPSKDSDFDLRGAHCIGWEEALS